MLRMRSASGPRSSDITMMPGFTKYSTAAERRHDRKGRVTPIAWREGRIEQPSVDRSLGMETMIAHDLRAGERPDRRAEEDVARPMTIVVHARHADGRRAAIHQRSDDIDTVRPPPARLGAHG